MTTFNNSTVNKDKGESPSISATNKRVVIHSRLAHGLPSCGKLYYYCRAYAVGGKTVFNVEQAAKELGCKARTIFDWLYKSKELELFRYYERKGNTILVYIAAASKVASKLHLVAKASLDDGKEISYIDWGTRARVPLTYLKQLKSIATYVELLALQDKSLYAARRKKHRREVDINPKYLFNTNGYPCSDSQQVTSIISCYKSVPTVLVKPNTLMFGASHQGVAKKLEAHTRTVQYRLKKFKRYTGRLAKYVQDITSKFSLKELTEYSDKHYFTLLGKIYQYHTNVYYHPDTIRLLKNRYVKLNYDHEGRILGIDKLPSKKYRNNKTSNKRNSVTSAYLSNDDNTSNNNRYSEKCEYSDPELAEDFNFDF